MKLEQPPQSRPVFDGPVEAPHWAHCPRNQFKNNAGVAEVMKVSSHEDVCAVSVLRPECR